MIWGIVIAGLIMLSGRVIDIYVKDKKAPWNYWLFPFSLFAFGFISTAICNSLYNALINWPDNFTIEPFFTISFIGNLITGIMISIVGAITYHYIKEIYRTEKTELEIDQNKEQFKIIDIWDKEELLNLTIYNHGIIDVTISDVYFDGIRVNLFLFGRGEEITSDSLHKIGFIVPINLVEGKIYEVRIISSRGEKSIDYWKSNHTH